ncbi:MAG: hypothetical protein NC350_05490, partial [Corallococcus sp.]|nr:hypothetical protein [Corallococcus sp.]
MDGNKTQTVTSAEGANKPVNKKKRWIIFACIVLAAVIITLCIVLRPKHAIELEVRISFPEGELRSDGDWYIPYDGKEHTAVVTFWDGNKQVFYKNSGYYDTDSYSIS